MKKQLFFFALCLCFLAGCTTTKNTEQNNGISAEETTEADIKNETISIYSWDLFFLNDGAFLRMAPLLRDLNVNRIYQEIPTEYLSLPETVVMVENLENLGIQTVFLTGDRDWQTEGLNEFFSQIDSLAAYNSGIGKSQPITAVALDVESYTTDAWKESPKQSFLDYIELMEDACQYAHKSGFKVIQVIPPSLDDIDIGLFERFLTSCCDELSIMNYEKSSELTAIQTEVSACSDRNIPVETIYETMPENEYYSVTADNTYFYDSMKSIFASQEKMRSNYGTNIGFAYHYYRTIYHLYTGAGFAQIYPYTSSNDSSITENKQTECVGSILLSGSDGSQIPAYLYHPNRNTEENECCYLAVGVKPAVEYTITLENPFYQLTDKEPVVFDFSNDRIVDTLSLHIRPNK
jgi:hypothetical protein